MDFVGGGFRLLLREGIFPFEAGEAGKIGVRGVKNQPPVDGKRGQMRVRGQVSGGSQAG